MKDTNKRLGSEQAELHKENLRLKKEVEELTAAIEQHCKVLLWIEGRLIDSLLHIDRKINYKRTNFPFDFMSMLTFLQSIKQLVYLICALKVVGEDTLTEARAKLMVGQEMASSYALYQSR